MCLVNRDNGLGFPTKEIALDNGNRRRGQAAAASTCPRARHGRRFAGDGAVTPSTATLAGVGGTVPATLSVMLGAPASFGAFAPGVAREYTASTTATVTSTAADAALTVADPTATNKLVNGAFTLAQPLQGLGTVKTWTTPTAGEVVAVEFKQAISASEPLRTGNYAKTLTFTLSTTAP